MRRIINENPESNISSNNDVDFKMEPKIETITKRKHGVNNTSKSNNDSNNNNSHNKNKDYVSSKETYKDKDNHKDKNEKSSKERMRKQETKETADQNTGDRKGKPSIFIMGDSELIKWLSSSKKKLNMEVLVKYDRSQLQKSAVCRTTSSLLFET